MWRIASQRPPTTPRRRKRGRIGGLSLRRPASDSSAPKSDGTCRTAHLTITALAGAAPLITAVAGGAGGARRAPRCPPRRYTPPVPDPHADNDPRPLARGEPPFDPRPVTLTGHRVRLEPLREAHVPGLLQVAFDPETWRWMREQVTDEAGFRRYIAEAFGAAATGEQLPFVQLDVSTGRPIGMTRYCAISVPNRRLEIGYTWLAAPWRGNGTNAASKLLLLSHAFETLGAHRVEFKTDAQNARSRAALAAIGATEEGIFRRHIVTLSGRVRDSVYFSVIWEEWPAVRGHLEERVAAAEQRTVTPAAGEPQ